MAYEIHTFHQENERKQKNWWIFCENRQHNKSRKYDGKMCACRLHRLHMHYIRTINSGCDNNFPTLYHVFPCTNAYHRYILIYTHIVHACRFLTNFYRFWPLWYCHLEADVITFEPVISIAIIEDNAEHFIRIWKTQLSKAWIHRSRIKSVIETTFPTQYIFHAILYL